MATLVQGAREMDNNVVSENLQELEARIQQLEHQSFMSQQLLSTVIEGRDKDLGG